MMLLMIEVEEQLITRKNCTLIEYTQDYEEIRRWDLRLGVYFSSY